MALKKLGYNTYHFKEVGEPQNVRDKHLWCWREALIAKNFGSGKSYGRVEFDKLLGRYQVRHMHFLCGKRLCLTLLATIGGHRRSLCELLRRADSGISGSQSHSDEPRPRQMA